MNLVISYSIAEICINKAIKEICEKSMWHGSFLRLAAVTRIFSAKQKTHFKIRSMRVCVQNIRSVLFFVWPWDVAQINTYTNIQVKLGISSTGCSVHVDFDKDFCRKILQCEIKFFSILKTLNFILRVEIYIFLNKCYLGLAISSNPGYLKLRKIRAAQSIARTVSFLHAK